MGQKNLPLTNCDEHVKAFERCLWTLDKGRRGNGTHPLMYQPGNPIVLSIPDHDPVKRGTLAALVKAAGISEDVYNRAMRKRLTESDLQTLRNLRDRFGR